jgi:mono/diheme cytochrome c family protein
MNAQDEDEDSPYRGGLVATYRDQSGHEATRVDSNVALVGRSAAVDPRLQSGPLHVTWRGFLLSQVDGKYRLAIFACGKVRISLSGHIILDCECNEPGWRASEPVDLTFAWHPLEIQFAGDSSSARLTLFWSGPNFQLEPIAPWSLFHDAEKSPSNQFERGAQLARALRCDACHAERLNRDAILAAPSLREMQRSIEPGWLVEWLSATLLESQSDETVEHWPRRMPHFGLSKEDAAALSGFLLQDQPPREEAAVAEQSEVDNGRQLFLSLGCLACHGLESFGEADLFGGGDLSRIAAKRRSVFFAKWLADPAASNSKHRMPIFELSDVERNQLAAFLGSLGKPTLVSVPRSEQSLRRGEQLFITLRCAACHDSNNDDAKPNKKMST